MKNLLFFLVLFGSGSLFAARELQFVTVTYNNKTTEHYFVISKTEKIYGKEKDFVNVKSQELTLLHVEKETPYTIASTSQATLTITKRAGDFGFKDLRGKTPSGQPFEVPTLDYVAHTEEVKPAGTILTNVCGTNVLENKKKGKWVTEVCLSSAVVE